MRAVNLLPTQHRPTRARGTQAGSAYIIVGVLAAALLCALAYVVTANKVTERQDQTAEAKRDTAAAQNKLASLGQYGDFAKVAATRKASVASLSQARFDWERFMRELAHVMPKGIWLTGVDASTTGENYSSTGTAATSSAGEQAKPGATLEGCAKRQPAVATLMVRLRKLHAVEEVDLDESAKSGEAGGASSSSSSSSVSTGDCGRLYKFSVKAVFTPTPAATTAKRVPASLGGGS